MKGQARWADWMELGLGHLQIQPSEFWAITPREFFAAADGYLRRMGVADEPEPLTKAEVKEMFADYYRKQAEQHVN